MKIFSQMKSSFSGCRNLLVAAALFCLSALSATAQTTITQNHIIYTLLGSKHAAMASGTDYKYIKSIVIADEVTNSQGETFPVTSIGSKAFSDCSSVSNVVIGSNVTEIGSYAFSGCGLLQRISIAEGVKTIGDNAFQNSGLHYAELPSTLRSLGAGAFKSNQQDLDTLVLHTAYYDASKTMVGLPFEKSAFNSTVAMNKCTLMVPKKAYTWYKERTAFGAPSWGYFFLNIIPFGTAPTGYSVLPEKKLQSYRDLANVAVTFNFDDETLTDLLSFGAGDTLDASLVFPDGTSLPADGVQLRGNTLYFDFAEILMKHRDLFIAPSEGMTTMNVRLKMEGQILLEECPFLLADYFANQPISWSVPLLPSVYELPVAPIVRLKEQSPDGRYDYTAFESVTLEFSDYTDVSLAGATGAFVKASLYKDGQLLCTSEQASVTGDNTVAIAFKMPLDQLQVRRSSGVEGYEFTLKVEGQVSMKEGAETRNFHFMLPFAGEDEVPSWQVRPVYIPEPTGVSFAPADERVTLKDLTDIAVSLEGVSRVSLLDAAASEFSASLRLGGSEVLSIGADRVRIVGNTLHLIFDPIDESAITLITADEDYCYDATLHLTADLLTDGYPCRVAIGEGAPAAGEEGLDAADRTVYTQHWTAPRWSIPAVVREVPSVTINVPAVADEEVITYEQLKVIEIEVENYKTVSLLMSASGAPAVTARLLRNGHSVCVVSSIEMVENKIIIDFSDKLTLSVVGITPEDDPDAPLEFTLCFEGDLLFDGLPHHFVYDGVAEELMWLVQPFVISQLPKPTIEYANGGIYFTSGVDGVEYHYSISNADVKALTTAEAVKGDGGSRLQVPLQKTYIIKVYATREGYEDSEEVIATLTLGAAPTIVVDGAEK